MSIPRGARLAQPSSLQYISKRYDIVPNSLKVLPRWGTFRLRRGGDGALGKTPVGGFSSTDAKTHCTFEAAQTALEHKRGDVLGFAMPSDRSMTGLDFDHCLDADGNLLPWAAPYLTPFLGRTYGEITPSGAGLRFYMLGHKPGQRCKHYGPDGGAIEIYDHDRLFTVTGNRYQDAPSEIAEMQAELDALYAALFPPREERPAQSGEPITLSDQELLDKAMKNATFAALWRGDLAGKPSPSEGDSALAYRLAWWTDSDTARIERLMRASGRTRDKWDKHDGTYGTHLLRTIHNAIEANAGRCYSGAKADFWGCQDDTSENATPTQETTGATASKNENDCCASKDKIIAQLQIALAKERQRIKKLEAELAWERKLRANKHLSPAHKLVGSALREQWAKAQAKGAPVEEMAVHLPTLAKKIGMSERTVSGAIVQLHDMGAVQRDEKHRVAESGPNKGKRVTRVFVQPQALLDAPDKLQPEKPRNHGGRRVCPSCGSKHLRVKLHAELTCMECGTHWKTESAERILRGDEAEMTARSDAMVGLTSGSPDADCAVPSVQIRGGNVCTPEIAVEGASGLNHRDERAELLARIEALPDGWRTRIPVGLGHNEGGTKVRWLDFTERADNALIDEALRQIRIRAEGLQEEVR